MTAGEDNRWIAVTTPRVSAGARVAGSAGGRRRRRGGARADTVRRRPDRVALPGGRRGAGAPHGSPPSARVRVHRARLVLRRLAARDAGDGRGGPWSTRRVRAARAPGSPAPGSRQDAYFAAALAVLGRSSTRSTRHPTPTSARRCRTRAAAPGVVPSARGGSANGDWYGRPVVIQYRVSQSFVGLVVTQAAMFATTVYLHRGLTHRALVVHPSLAFVCRFCLWITTGMRPREWAAVHRRHHAATDTPDDPHSPVQHGLLARAADERRDVPAGRARRRHRRQVRARHPRRPLRPVHVRPRVSRPRDRHHVAVRLFTLLFGPWGSRSASSPPPCTRWATSGLSGAVNAIGHTLGRRPNENSATNGWLLALVHLW